MQDVKNALDKCLRLAGYGLNSRNDMLGIYQVGIVNGIWTAIMNASLSKSQENETKCVFEIMNTVGGNAAPAILSDLQDTFLKNFSGFLDGSLIVGQKGFKNNNLNRQISIFLITVILGSIAIFSLFYFLLN